MFGCRAEGFEARKTRRGPRSPQHEPLGGAAQRAEHHIVQPRRCEWMFTGRKGRHRREVVGDHRRR